MSYKIPMGPYHPALEEPYKLGISCKGETVQAVTVEIGGNDGAEIGREPERAQRRGIGRGA